MEMKFCHSSLPAFRRRYNRQLLIRPFNPAERAEKNIFNATLLFSQIQNASGYDRTTVFCSQIGQRLNVIFFVQRSYDFCLTGSAIPALCCENFLRVDLNIGFALLSVLSL